MLYSEKIGSESNTACVFLHAFPLDSEMWYPQIELISKELCVILIDLPGFGKSHLLEPLSMEIMAAEVSKVLDNLKIHKAIFLGLSMGGYVIFNMVRLFPEKVSALILCDTTPSSDTEQKRQNRLELIKQIEEKGVEILVQQMIPNLLSEHTLLYNKPLVNWIKQKFLNVKPESAIAALKAMANRKDHTELIKKTKIPTLLIFGEEDKITSANMHIKNSLLRKIKNAGHYSNLENPKEFNSALLEFITYLKTKQK
jgi:pimeloyl-ACP methyl ester carboxylesterase